MPDLNLLLYAYNPYVGQHAKARQWWEHAVNGQELIELRFMNPLLEPK